MKKRIKLKTNRELVEVLDNRKGYRKHHAGSELTIEADKNGTPTSNYWRALKNAKEKGTDSSIDILEIQEIEETEELASEKEQKKPKSTKEAKVQKETKDEKSNVSVDESKEKSENEAS